MDHKAFRWALSFIVTLQLATAHIGLRYMVYEHKEGSIPLRVYLKLPESAPGIVDISFKSFSDNIDRISVSSELKGSVEVGENSSRNIAIPVNGEENTFSSKLPLFKYGAYSINVEVQQNGKIEQVIIPVNFSAGEKLELDSISLSVLFVTAFFLSFLGIFFIRNAYSYNRKKEFDKTLKSKNNSRFLQFAEIFIIIFMISYVSIKWWDERKINYDQNNYFNLKNDAKIVNNGIYDILEINIVDKKWINEKMPILIPDHGKIMHMYMISDDFRYLAHLHPTRSEDRNSFFVRMPPFREGDYSLYMDITHDTGFSHTMTNKINYNRKNIVIDRSITTPLIDPDDSWTQDLDAIKITWVDMQSFYEAEKDIPMRFKIEKNGKPTPIQSYMGMGAHAALIKNDGSIFAHLHPTGTINMASKNIYELGIKKEQMIDNKNIELDLINPKHDHFSNQNYSVNGEVGFPPLRLIKAGDYTVWVQVKAENKIITQKFNFTISS